MFWAYISMLPYIAPFLLLFVVLVTRRMSQLRLFVLLVSAYIVGDKVIKNLVKSMYDAI